jgi:hypothetical protein
MNWIFLGEKHQQMFVGLILGKIWIPEHKERGSSMGLEIGPASSEDGGRTGLG